MSKFKVLIFILLSLTSNSYSRVWFENILRLCLDILCEFMKASLNGKICRYIAN